ncbi:hypothetical protein [uncultured Shimia sp.]|uniref:hypothetical protein n=1 Tax=uncultured Shimia sp. TaxID=573152 RepID=UPI002614D7EB|nr:hypothetical protein [uncultured Shimia sp.]
MDPDTGGHEKSGLGKRLFFIFGGIGLLCLIGLLVFGHFFRQYANRCLKPDSATYIIDDIARSEQCD